MAPRHLRMLAANARHPNSLYLLQQEEVSMDRLMGQYIKCNIGNSKWSMSPPRYLLTGGDLICLGMEILTGLLSELPVAPPVTFRI